MATEQLLAALRSEGERKAGLVREQAEAAAAHLRGEADTILAQLRRQSDQELAESVQAQERAILAEAERAARLVRLAGAERLAARLFRLALQLLPRLEEGDRAALFARLAAELPPCAWETVRLNPADEAQAAQLFAGARLVPDPSISGGLEVWAQGGRMQVVNTLEKRLERGWWELLPLLLKEVEDSV